MVRVSSRVRRVRPTLLLLLTLLFVASVTGIALAQWPARTLRDTLYVPANKFVTTQAKIAPGTSVQMQIDYTGTFSAFAGQDSGAIDAAYTYRVPNWTAPFPLANPPSYNKTSYSIYVEAKYDNLTAVKAQFLETTPQTDHHYTWRQWGTGARWQFRIFNRADERPDGYYYAQSKGGVTIRLTQFTAGIAVKSKSLDFGTTNIGFPTTLIDSIQAYGLDPLQVDSVWIDGADASAFSIASQRGDHFTLANESTNDFHIRFSPVRTGYHNAILHLHAANADAPSRWVNISLRGLGAAPSLAIGPKIVDFGKVRVTGQPVMEYVNLYNSGNADLHVTGITTVNGSGTPSGVFGYKASIPLTVAKGNSMPVPITFTPRARQKYQAVLHFSGLGVADDSVLLMGEGGMPDLVLKDTILNFDTVYSGDMVTRTTRITNTGNWTAKIIMAPVSGGSMAAYHVTPDDSKGFLLNAGDSRDYSITFQPLTNTDGPHVGALTFSFDDGAPSKSIQLNGYELKRRLEYDTKFIDFGRVKLYKTPTRAVHVNNNSTTSVPVVTKFQQPNFNPFSVTYSPSMAKPGIDSIQFGFHPVQRGRFTNWAVFNSNGQRDSVQLNGIGAEALAKFTPDTLFVGVVPTGQTGSNFTVVTDTGDFPLYVIGVRVVGPDAKDFTPFYKYTQTQKIDTVREGGIDARNIGVTFSTSERTGRTHHATVELIFDDSTKSSFPVAATEASGHVQFATKSLDYGKVRVGRQQDAKVSFVNPMQIPLTVGTIWAAPTGTPFVPSQTSTTVDASSTASIKLTFAPTSRGVFSAYLHASDGDMLPDSIPVTGIGAQSVSKFSTTTVDFNTVPLHSASAPMILTLSNIGDWPLAGTVMKLKDPYGEFSVSGPNGPIAPTGIDTVLPDSAHVYSITFSPKRPALPNHVGELLFTFDDGTSQTIELVGKDVSYYLGLDSNFVNFGKVRVGRMDRHDVHLINTSSTKLTADQLQIVVPTAPFTANPNTNVTVAPNTMTQIQVDFQPTAMGPVSAMLLGQGSAFENQNGDTVILQGVGAMPIPQLAQPQLDFGPVIVGDAGTQSTTLTNAGNWPLITHMTVSGPNAADFTVHFAQDTTIAEGESTTISADFIAQTPLQPTPRTATATFTLDDGSTFTLDLVAHDKAPLGSQVGFGNYIGRPGDKITVYLKLRTAIPATMNVQDLKGSVSFDPSIAELLDIEQASIALEPFWHSTITNRTNSGFDYELTSSTASLTDPGALYKLTFQMRTDVKPGGRSPLSNVCNFPSQKQVTAVPVSGVILVDSACGSTHVSAGQAHATFVMQNTPNPFGGDKPETSIPFDVGDNGAIVTLRILDPVGHEITRPIDRVAYSQGHHSVNVAASLIGTGAFYYEFLIDGQTPQIKKMIVQ